MDIVDELFDSYAANALTNRAAREIARLRSVCGEAYQMAGALGASVEAMEWNWMDDDAGEIIPAWVRETLGLPTDDSALREMIEAAKAEEREACAAFVEKDCADNQMADPLELKEVATAIRSRKI